MKINSQKKQYILFLLAIMLVVFFAFQFMATATEGQLVSVVGTNQTTNEIGRETLEILLQLQALSLDGSLFEDAVFKYLTDFSVILVARPMGRENPFAAIDLEEALKNQNSIEPETKPAL